MGFGIQPTVARATYPFNCLAARLIPQRKQVLVLTYHRIGTRREIWPETTSLAECSTEQFEEQMQWLHDYCSPIDAETLDSIIRGERPCPNRAVLVTFDDGYRADMYRVRPCLERLGIRPIMFLPTDYVGTKRRFWWDRIGVSVHTSVERWLVLDIPHRVELALDEAASRDAACEILVGFAKGLSVEEREAFFVRLEAALKVPSAAEATSPQVVSWDEVREFRSTFDFGAHTTSHPVLSRLSLTEIRDEMVRSKAIVEEQTGRPCFTFAIPFGRTEDYTADTMRAASEAGLHLVFSLEDTLRLPQKVNGAALVDRITLNAVSGVEGVAAKVTWPQLFIPDWSGKLQQRLHRLWQGA